MIKYITIIHEPEFFTQQKVSPLHLREVRIDVLAEAGELVHHAAADGGILGLADEQQGIDAGEHTVDIGNAALILEVDAAAHAPDDELCTDGLGKVGGQPLVADDMDARLILI